MFTQPDVYAVALFRTLIEKGFSREVAGDYVDQFFSRSWRKPDMTVTRSLQFLVQAVAVCFALLCVGHVVSGRAFAAQSSPAKQGADQSGATDDPFKKPLTLESYKSFFVGGERVKRPDGTQGMTGHLYSLCRGIHSGKCETDAHCHAPHNHVGDEFPWAGKWRRGLGHHVRQGRLSGICH